MKQISKWAGMLSLVLILGSGALAPQLKAQPGVSVSINAFYDELRPHGTWRQDPVYGQVWQPRAERDFRPYYSRGHWVMTDAGNTWASEYDWGWAPFHYGRWVQRRNIGWIWVPGTEWAPAWVSWRSGGDDYGWAPLTPEVNITLNIGGHNSIYNNDYYYNGYAGNANYGYDAYQDDIPVDYWVFVPRRQIFAVDFHRYYRGPRYNTTIIRNTTIINNINVYNNVRYSYGPRPDDIRRYTGRPVPVYRLQNNTRPGRTVVQNNVVNIYRPNVRITSNNRFANNRFIDNRVNRNAHRAVLNRTENARVDARRNTGAVNPNTRDANAIRRQRLQNDRATQRQQQLNPNGQVQNANNAQREKIRAERAAQREQATQAGKPNVRNPRADAVHERNEQAQAQRAAEREAAQQKRRREIQAQRAAHNNANPPVKAEHPAANPQREAIQAQRAQQRAAERDAARQQAQQQRAARQPQRAPQANPSATRPAPADRAAQREAAQEQKRKENAAARDARRQEQRKAH